MSSAQFYRMHKALMRPGTPDDHAERVEEAFAAARDTWINEGRHAELVGFILGNWTAGNCGAFMRPLSRALAESGEMALLNHLWARTIKRQVERFFHHLRTPWAWPVDHAVLMAADVSDFVETSPNAYLLDRWRAIAFLYQRLQRDLAAWEEDLVSGGDPPDEPRRIGAVLSTMRVPRIRVPPRPKATSQARVQSTA